MKALVVEEIGGQQSAVCECLQRQHYRVELVSDGRAAISRAAHETFDLIILDLMQPTESSLLVLHEIRELNQDSEILVLSAPEQISDRVTALIQGADDFLIKPFTADDLDSCILSLISQRGKAGETNAHSVDGHHKTTHLNQLIENLLRLCQGENHAIELIISDVKLYRLICNAIACVYSKATRKEAVISSPLFSLPGILADARWMEHLLVNLLCHAIAHCSRHTTIHITFLAAGEVGDLVVEFVLDADSDDHESILRGLDDSPQSGSQHPVDSLVLAKFCAQSLNLELQGRVTDNNRLQMRVCNIRIV